MTLNAIEMFIIIIIIITIIIIIQCGGLSGHLDGSTWRCIPTENQPRDTHDVIAVNYGHRSGHIRTPSPGKVFIIIVIIIVIIIIITV